MSEPDEGGSRPSPMIYDGGLRISEDGNSFIPVDHRVFITCYSALSRRTRWALAFPGMQKRPRHRPESVTGAPKRGVLA